MVKLCCPTCFIKAGEGGNNLHVPTNSVMDIAEYMGQNGLIEVRLTGGEPTTHPDFLDILHKFKQERLQNVSEREKKSKGIFGWIWK
jgi:molybdenum cofactor biosynthesis enzyme MoaA|tara:strand:+ start:738 stop:998 length:261 start_codon:yes stop_codon:yes gene_type:complete